jgi:hypothetical protein
MSNTYKRKNEKKVRLSKRQGAKIKEMEGKKRVKKHEKNGKQNNLPPKLSCYEILMWTKRMKFN